MISTRVYWCRLLLAGAQSTGHSGPWELEDSGSTAGLRGIPCRGGGVVGPAAPAGTILRSEDTGYLWQHCTTPPGAGKLDFRGIWAWDAQTALAAVERARRPVAPLSDDGWVWQLEAAFDQPRCGAAFWDGILFLDRQHGVDLR